MHWLHDFPTFTTSLIKIRNKSGRLVPLHPTAIQSRFIQHITQPNNPNHPPHTVVLKGRQTRITTIVLAHVLWRSIMRTGHRAVTVAQDDETTRMVFDRVRNIMHKNLPPEIKPALDRSNERTLSLIHRNSTYYARTASGASAGRSDTLHYLHCTEFAFWQNYDYFTGASQAIAPGGTIIIESTPNGYNEFYQIIQKTKTGQLPGYSLIFLPWFLEPTYAAITPTPIPEWTPDEHTAAAKALTYNITLTPNQITWRRTKQAELESLGNPDLFLQEYPEDPATCFLVSGRPRFNNKYLNTLIPAIQALPPPIEDTTLATMHLRIWQRPIPTESYLLSADSSEGLTAGDYANLIITRYSTNEKVLDLHGHCEPHQLADYINTYGRLYNTAEAAPEGNNTGYATLSHLISGHYPNIYRMRDSQGRITDRLGWWTDSSTRPLMIDTGAKFYTTATPNQIPDLDEIQEAMSFVIGPRGKPQAATGAHDDRVMTRLINLIQRQTYTQRPSTPNHIPLPQSRLR